MADKKIQLVIYGCNVTVTVHAERPAGYASEGDSQGAVNWVENAIENYREYLANYWNKVHAEDELNKHVAEMCPAEDPELASEPL